jgi:hypothetical protein
MVRKILICLLLCSCASLHNSNLAQPIASDSDGKTSQKGLVMSSEEMTDLSSEYFASFDFTIENTSSSFLKIKSLKLDFGDPDVNQKVQIPKGRELISWAAAAQQNRNIRDYNTRLVLDSLVVLGAGAIATGNNAATIGGAVVGGGALATSATRDVLSRKERVEKSELGADPSQQDSMVPSTHLAAGSFIVPPGMHAKKWVTLYTENPNAIPFINTAKLTVEFEDGTREESLLVLRKYIGSSKWQKNHPQPERVNADAVNVKRTPRMPRTVTSQ